MTLLFFLSGSAGLIYEVVWTRVFSDIVGSTALSMSAVFSVFLFSLALGAHLFGRLRVTGRTALAFYGFAELAIALSAMGASTALIQGRSWIAAHLPASESLLVNLAGQLLAIAVLIGLPATLMGGTLPLILSAARGWAVPRNVVAYLYGWNTLGAAFGALAAGMVLIWHLGLARTLAVAMALNLLAGCAALLLARRLPSATPTAPAPQRAAPASRAKLRLWPALAFFSGFAVLACEILWGRIAKFVLGDRTIAVSVLLFVFICGLGLASLIAPLLGRRFGGDRRRQVHLVAWCLVAGGLAQLVLVPLARATVAGAGLAGILPLENEFLRRVIFICVLVLPPVLLLGLVFPLLASGSRRIDERPGTVIGNLYFVNTVGAILGAIVATYALSRWLGTLGGFLALTGLVVAAGALLAWFSTPAPVSRVAALVAVVACAIGAAFVPTDLTQLREDEQLVDAVEDEYGVQVLATTTSGTMRVRNNRLSLVYDLGDWSTSHAQQMAAHLTVMLAGDCERVLNLGTGYGITAGTFTLYDEVQSIETVEVLPFLVERQHLFRRYNFNYLEDPRVRLIRGDGRHYLVTSGRTYDIISVNVLDPYLPGSSSLFTVDFWETVRAHLRPGGVFTGLFWGADVDLLSRGLKKVFPTLLYFPAYGDTSYNVVGFRDGGTPRLRLERLGLIAGTELQRLTGSEPREYLRDELARSLQAPPPYGADDGAASRLHTDDFPVLEYRWAHGAEWVSILDSPLVAVE